MSFLVVDGVQFSYGNGEHVLDDLSFNVEEGEIFALLGPSGSGKTTALRLVAGFERPSAGRLVLENDVLATPSQYMPPEKRRVGVVFQEFALFPHMTVLDNVMYGLHKLKGPLQKRRTLEILSVVSLGTMAGRLPQELSGGQQQRVALARALAPYPRLLLLDEAFASLDPHLRESTRRQTRDILRDQKMTAVLVTHDQQEAMEMADRVGLLIDGKLLQVGTPEELYRSPASKAVAAFLGASNFIQGIANGDTAETGIGELALQQKADGPVTLCARPEDLRAVASKQGNARISDRVFQGRDVLLTAKAGEYVLEVLCARDEKLKVGDLVDISCACPLAVVE